MRATAIPPITQSAKPSSWTCTARLGDYRSANTVIEFEPGSTLGWAPALDLSYPCTLVDRLAKMTTGGPTYTYRLREVDGGTEVTQVYDWLGVKDPQFATFCPFASDEELVDALGNLARLVEAAP